MSPCAPLVLAAWLSEDFWLLALDLSALQCMLASASWKENHPFPPLTYLIICTSLPGWTHSTSIADPDWDITCIFTPTSALSSDSWLPIYVWTQTVCGPELSCNFPLRPSEFHSLDPHWCYFCPFAMIERRAGGGGRLFGGEGDDESD